MNHHQDNQGSYQLTLNHQWIFNEIQSKKEIPYIHRNHCFSIFEFLIYRHINWHRFDFLFNNNYSFMYDKLPCFLFSPASFSLHSPPIFYISLSLICLFSFFLFFPSFHLLFNSSFLLMILFVLHHCLKQSHDIFLNIYADLLTKQFAPSLYI